ncbi:hypothetical protein PRZ01_10760 [Paucibacter sp. hw1]|uniref:Solute-binding protein family 3/N-terminal domain-containing protein n=2 Tax=Roseateles koreensis TaxID=2987526 RepID=A0ABT5KRX9_9BURK|nr:hypothetical protein [Roseateles koreensis]
MPELRIAASDANAPVLGMISSIAKEAGFEPKTFVFPIVRSRNELLAGNVDLEILRANSIVKAIYPKNMITIGPVMNTRGYLFVLKSAPTRKREDWLRQPLIYLNGNSQSERFATEHQLDAKAIGQRPSLYKMLMAGRAPAVIDEERYALAYLVANGLDQQVRKIEPPLFEDQLVLVLHPSKASFEAPLRQVVDRWLRDGRWVEGWHEIYKKQGLPLDLNLLPQVQSTEPASARRP